VVFLFDHPTPRALALNIDLLNTTANNSNGISRVADASDVPVSRSCGRLLQPDHVHDFLVQQVLLLSDAESIFRRLAVSSLSNEEFIGTLLQCLSNHTQHGDGIARVFFDLCLSPSGSPVSVVQPHAESTAAVLLFGYAGSSRQSLQPICDMYAARLPTWRIITMTAVWCAETLGNQLNEIMRHVSGCKHLIVHSMSNHGHYAWTELLRCHGEVVHKSLRGIVFDCGPSSLGRSSPESRA